MNENTFLTIAVAVLFAFIGLFVFMVLSDVQVTSTYKQSVTVQNAAEVPIAISNVVNKVEEKGFLLTRIRTVRNVFTGSYTIEVGGKEPNDFVKSND